MIRQTIIQVGDEILPLRNCSSRRSVAPETAEVITALLVHHFHGVIAAFVAPEMAEVHFSDVAATDLADEAEVPNSR